MEICPPITSNQGRPSPQSVIRNELYRGINGQLLSGVARGRSDVTCTFNWHWHMIIKQACGTDDVVGNEKLGWSQGKEEVNVLGKV